MLSFIRLLPLVGCVIYSLSSVAQLPELYSSDFVDAKYNAYILEKRIMELTNLPGMAVTVSYRGEVVYQEGLGYEDIEQRIYVRPDTTIFRLADISKVFTSVLMMKAVEKNYLDLDSPVQEYVSYYPKKKYPISLRGLACHTAGVRPLAEDERSINRDFDSVKKGISLFKKDKLLFRPATEFLYSDHGWSLIGASIESAYKYDFQRIAKDRLLDPLGLKNIYLEQYSADIPNMAKSYVHDRNSDIQYASDANYSHVSPGMAFAASSNALAQFANKVLFENGLSDKLQKEMLSPCTLRNGKRLNYALGWMVDKDDEGRVWYGHSGSGSGASGMLLVYPDYELVVVVLLNLSEAKIRDLPFRIAQQFIDTIEQVK